MPSPAETSRARRSDVLVLLVLAAASLPAVVGFVVTHTRVGWGVFGLLLRRADAMARAGDWAGCLWQLVLWFSWDVGVLVVPLLVVGGALRFYSRRTTTVAVATYSVAAALILCGVEIRDAVHAWGAPVYLDQIGVSTSDCVIRAISKLGPALLPVAVLVAAWRWRGVLLSDPPRRAAHLTRAVVLAMAAEWMISIPVL